MGVFRYNPRHSRPEYLADYQLPCGSSQVIREIESIEERAFAHTMAMQTIESNGLDKSLYLNRASRIFEDPLHEHRRSLSTQYGDIALALDDAHRKQKEARQTSDAAQRGFTDILAGKPVDDESEIQPSSHMGVTEHSTRAAAFPTDRYRGNQLRHITWSSDRMQTSFSEKRKAREDDDEWNPSEVVMAEKTSIDRMVDLRNAANRFSLIASSRADPSHGTASRLRDLIKGAAGDFEKDSFSQRVAEIFDSKNEELRKMLDTVMAPVRNMGISSQMSEEMRTTLESEKQELKCRLDTLKRKTGDPTEEIRMQLASAVIEGPIAKQRQTLARIKYRLIRSVGLMPFKTELDQLEKWLRTARRFVVPPIGDETASEFQERRARLILQELTVDVEEQYRRYHLAMLWPMFQEEAATLTLSMINDPRNSTLPEIYRSMQLHRIDRAKDNPHLANKFYAPQFTFDRTLDRFSNTMAHDMLETNVACGLGDNQLKLMHMTHSTRYTALRHGKSLPSNELLVGPPGIGMLFYYYYLFFIYLLLLFVGKSAMLEQFQKMNLQSATVPSDYESRLAACVAKPHDYFMLVCDEGHPWVVDAVERMNSAGKEDRDRKKSHLSSQTSSFQRNVKGKDEQREKQSITASYIHQIIMNANKIQPTKETSVLERFRLTLICPPKRKDDSMVKRVLASHINFEDNNFAREALYQLRRDEHYVIGTGVALQVLLLLLFFLRITYYSGWAELLGPAADQHRVVGAMAKRGRARARAAPALPAVERPRHRACLQRRRGLHLDARV